ncbi:hypothetical protein Tco_1392225 [Tanacetum coccineum]
MEERGFFESINTDPFSGPQWVDLFLINEPVYRELVHEFFGSIKFETVASRYDPEHVGISFRLGGESRSFSLLEFGRRVGLYSKDQALENGTRIGLRNAVTVKAEHLLMEFWPTIRDGVFVVGARVPIRLGIQGLGWTIFALQQPSRVARSPPKESPQLISLPQLHLWIRGPFATSPLVWLRYLRWIREKDLICGVMFVTRLARSFRIVIRELMDSLSVEPRAHTFKKKSLILMRLL